MKLPPILHHTSMNYKVFNKIPALLASPITTKTIKIDGIEISTKSQLNKISHGYVFYKGGTSFVLEINSNSTIYDYPLLYQQAPTEKMKKGTRYYYSKPSLSFLPSIYYLGATIYSAKQIENNLSPVYNDQVSVSWYLKNRFKCCLPGTPETWVSRNAKNSTK